MCLVFCAAMCAPPAIGQNAAPQAPAQQKAAGSAAGQASANAPANPSAAAPPNAPLSAPATPAVAAPVEKLQAETSGSTPKPVYKDTQGGLEKLGKDILRAEKDGNTVVYRSLLDSLLSPVPDAWFTETFGDAGSVMLKDYSGKNLEPALNALFQKLVADKFTDVQADKYETSCDSSAGPEVFPLLHIRQNSTPLYQLRFFHNKEFYPVWMFVYVNGGFHFIAGAKAPENPPVEQAIPIARKNDRGGSGRPPMRIQITGKTASTMLASQVMPKYPDIAKRGYVSGEVVMHALIGKDGSVQWLRVISGPCLLDASALEAVRQWRYKPLVLNGVSVEADTTISVVYTLGE